MIEVSTEMSAPIGSLAGFVPVERTSQIKARTALTLERLVFFGLLVTLVLTAIPYGTVDPWWEAAFVCVVFALAAVRIVHALLTGAAEIRGHALLLPLLCLCVFSFLQTLPLVPAELGSVAARSTISTDPHETRRFVFKLLSLIIAGELLLRFTSNRLRFGLLVHTVIGVGVMSALLGLLRQFTQGESSFLLSGLTTGVGYGQFINANHFAFLMEMSLGLLVGLITGGGIDPRRRPAYWVMALLVWMALVLSNSRGGVISMLTLMLFIAFVTVNNKAGRILKHHGRSRVGKLIPHAGRIASCIAIIAMFGLVLTVAVVWVGGDAVVSRLETVSGEVSVEKSDKIRRIEIWKATWQLTKDHPFVGVGFGGYWTAIPKYFRATGESSLQQAHNDYIEILASGGLIGAGLVVWFAGAVIYSAYKSRGPNNAFYRASRLGALAGLLAVAVHSFVDFGLHITTNSLVFVILIVIITTDLSVDWNRTELKR
jgi:O-antigen ligase